MGASREQSASDEREGAKQRTTALDIPLLIAHRSKLRSPNTCFVVRVDEGMILFRTSRVKTE